MKKLFTITLSLFFAAALSAQITVEASDYTYEYNSTVSFIRAETPTDASLPELGEDMLWDYTSVSFPSSEIYVADTETDYSGDEFPEANGQVGSTAVLNLFDGVFRESILYSRYDENGFSVVGSTYLPLSIPLESLTGVPTDSIVYGATSNYYPEEPSTVVKFPLNFGDVQQDHVRYETDNLLLTATPFGLNNAPVQIVGKYEEYGAVQGWGKLRVIDPVSAEPVEFPVLLNRIEGVLTDSFFLAGSPAPEELLTPFGQSQGNQVFLNEFKFYAKGFSSFAMIISERYVGNYDVRLNADIIGYVSSLYAPAADLLDMTTAPNPSSGDFTLTFDKTNAADWSFSLINMQGAAVHRQTLDGETNAQNYRIAVPTFVKGAHVYIVRDDSGKVVGSGKINLQ